MRCLLLVLAIGSLVNGQRVKMEVFGESQCHYCTRHIVHHIAPLFARADDLPDHVDFEYFPFGNAKCQAIKTASGARDYKCQCQHGRRECLGNQIQSCIKEYFRKDPRKYLPPMACVQGRDPRYARWCLQQFGIPSGEILTCAYSPKGRTLMAEAGIQTKLRARNKRYVPWVQINERWYDNDVIRAVGLDRLLCHLLNYAPRACQTANTFRHRLG